MPCKAPPNRSRCFNWTIAKVEKKLSYDPPHRQENVDPSGKFCKDPHRTCDKVCSWQTKSHL